LENFPRSLKFFRKEEGNLEQRENASLPQRDGRHRLKIQWRLSAWRRPCKTSIFFCKQLTVTLLILW